MTWYRVGPAGIPGSLKTDMDAVLNKKFGTSTTYAPNTWPENVNLLGPLPEKTASGAIANITDGADGVPLKNWLVTLPASLDGYTAINGKKAKKNFLNDRIRGHNGANIYFAHDTGSQNDFAVRLRAGTYTFSVVTADGTTTNLYVKNSDTNTNITGFPAYNSLSKTFTLSEDTNCAVYVYKSGYTDVTDILTAQIEVGSTATAYEAYNAPTQYTASLGRTIYGGTADIVTGEGEDENGNAFTFTPITPTPETALGVNNFWADEGDSDVTYRADISLALQALGGGGRGLMGMMMQSPEEEQLTEEDPEEVPEETETDER